MMCRAILPEDGRWRLCGRAETSCSVQVVAHPRTGCQGRAWKMLVAAVSHIDQRGLAEGSLGITSGVPCPCVRRAGRERARPGRLLPPGRSTPPEGDTVRRVVPGARALALVACLRRGAEHAGRTLQHTPFAAGREHTLRGSRLEVSAGARRHW